ncbi:uncharacterized protein LOC123868470 [Maniola jurtina]|uniref:uncharacterized protein LOC123868470 n=1 Tax=Maniola jurtina TaxID=191418 RepID=UPI001E68E6AA|nr:uncharacterized protein LOC123868470 [Maniola jurtina]
MYQLVLELITTQTTMFKLVVLSVVLAVAAAHPQGVWGAGLAWGAPWAAGAAPLASPIFNPLFAPVGPVTPYGAPNYRGPLSLAPGQPANILGADGRPLDTLSVNLDRAVHYTARALEGNGRRLQKRSILAAPLATANLAGAGYAAGPYAAGGLAAAPLTLGRSWVGPAPLAPVAIAAAAPLGLGFGARVGNFWPTKMFRLVVLSVVLAVVAASPITFWDNGLTRPLASSWSAPLAAGFATPSLNYAPLVPSFGPVPPVGAPNYRGPLSLASGQPANILAADGRPLDTLSVNLDRAVHYTAKALEGNGQRLQKRSILAAPLNAANLAGARYAAGPWTAGAFAAGPLAATPLAAAHLTLGRSWVGPAPVAPAAIAVAAPLGL